MFNILLDISDQRRVKLLETEHPLPLSLPPSPPPSPFLSPHPKFIVQCIMYGLRVKTGIEEAHSQAHIPTQKQTYTED